MEFRIGDIVERIECDNRYSSGRVLYKGSICKVIEIYDDDDYMTVEFDGEEYWDCGTRYFKLVSSSKIKQVIFNPPATIILWNDNTKSVVKCQDGEPYDAEKGFALAYLKKLLGNDNTFNKEIHKWVKYDAPVKDEIDVNEPITIEQLMKMDGQKVYVVSLDRNGKEDHKLEFTGWRTVSVSDKFLYRDQYYYSFDSMNKPFGYHAYLNER